MSFLMTLSLIPAEAVFADEPEAVVSVVDEMQSGEKDLPAEEDNISVITAAETSSFEENVPDQTGVSEEVPVAGEGSADQEGASEEEPADQGGVQEVSEISEAGDGEGVQTENDAAEDEASGRGAGEKLLTVSGSGTSRTITVAETSAGTSMMAAVWSDEGSQDDLKWYTMSKQSDGSFTASISVGNLRHSGTCYVHVYSGSTFIDGAAFNVTEEELAEFRLKVTGSGTTRTITLPGIYNGTVFRAAVWSKEGGQDDLKWHDMTKQPDGSYCVTVSAADMKHSGTCYVHVYSGTGFIDGSAFEFSEEDMAALRLTVNGSGGTRTITLPAGYSITSLRAAIWSETGGQDDLKWYDMTKQPDGSWETEISAENLLHTGTCIVHLYSGSTFIDGNKFTIADDEITLPSLSVSGSDGTRTLTVSDGSALKNVRAAVWSKEGGQDDLIWYDMAKQPGGSWTLDISAGSFKHSGICYAHVYSGNNYVDGAEFQITEEEYEESKDTIFTVSGTGGRRTLTVSGPYTELSSLKAAVWSETGGQDDLKWYTAEKQADGTWKIDISISVLLNGGTINVHGYSGNTFEFGIFFDISDTEFESAVQDLTHQYAQAILDYTGGTLRGAYDWAVQNISYQSLVTPMSVPNTGTYASFTRQELYLVYAFTNLRGNCFCYAAPVFWCAKELGYTVRLMEYMYYYNNNPADIRPHGWVEIDINGVTYILDAELQHQYSMDCFMIQSSPLYVRRDLPAY